MSSCVRQEVEPIYESVPAPRSPVNLFLSLVGSQETISPDPNIYEVPPGAILNLSDQPEDSPNNITPPNEFQDDRTDRSQNSLIELNPKLQDIYSQVNKPKTKMETVINDTPSTDRSEVVEEVTDWESSLTEPEDYASASESEVEQSNADDKKEEDPLKKNIGAQIMELHEADKKKLVSSMNLPEVTILDIEESYEDIEKERRRIIDKQVVKKKRIDCWIKENGLGDELEETNSEEGLQIVELMTDEEECTEFQVYINSEIVEDDNVPSQIHLEGEIVYDSILQNKEKTKNYWEKLMLATKMATNSMKKAGMEEPAGKVESVVEREIRLQREREEALILERQNAFKLAKYAEEGLHSIPTTDEGNYSECSEEKDQSLDSSGEQEAMTTFNNYQRTPSFESMSSGHSSGSDGVAKKRASPRKMEEQRTEPNQKIQKEPPIEKDIRIAKDRDEEIKPKPKPFNFNSKKSVKKVDEIRAELESISLKKCVSMSNLPLSPNCETNIGSTKPGLANAKFRQTTTRLSPSSDTASKIFTPSKIPRGLMKRFIESHGRLPTSFILSPPTINTPPAPRKINVSTEVLTPSPPSPVRSQDMSAPLRRPGYRSAEDKIQMELKEMKRREAELKQERARLLGRSQPNLLNIGLTEELSSDDEICSLPQMGKLRSALSNPNLTNERTVIIPKRCNELIDAWENMIQKKSED